HRLGDEAAQGRNALLDRGAGDEAVSRLLIDPALQLIPEAIVRPLVDVIVERALNIMPAAPGRAHGAERKTAGVVGIDQLVTDRRRVREDAEPAERIDPLELLDRGRLDAGAADAVEAVAAGDEVAENLVGDAVLHVGYARVTAVEIVRLHVLGLVDRSEPR